MYTSDQISYIHEVDNEYRTPGIMEEFDGGITKLWLRLYMWLRDNQLNRLVGINLNIGTNIQDL